MSERVLMWRCVCGTIGEPEDRGYRPAGKEKAPPYGWLRVVGEAFGCGPSFEVVACSEKCLSKAIAAALSAPENK